MKLVKPRKSNSFFESFSDLIFATMAIFVLLLILFISQQGETEAPVEYTGGSTATHSLIAHYRVDGSPHILFFPQAVADRLSMARMESVNDPLLALAEMAVSADGLTSVPLDDYVRMADGLSAAFAQTIRSQGEGTVEAGLLLEALSGPEAPTAEMLKNLVFEAGALRTVDGGKLRLKSPWAERYRGYMDWLQTHEDGNPHSWLSQSREPVRAAASPREDGRAVVTYRAGAERGLRVGDSELSPAQFRGFLRSIRSGPRFALIHVNDQGLATPPPPWVVRDVLLPAGFDASR